MAKISKREQTYIDQLKALGIFDPAFLPAIRQLCSLEREWTQAKKAWSDTAPPGGKPSFLDPLYPVVQSLRREILAHRESLGLTPKALRKLRGAPGEPVQQDLIAERLSAIQARVESYSLPDMSKMDTGEGGAPDA